MTVEELQVLITANTSALQKEIQNVKSSINGLTKDTTKFGSKMTKSFVAGGVITQVLSAGIQAVSNSLGDAVTRLDTLNNYTNVMSNLGIATEDAEASMKKLSDGLLGLPTTLDSAVGSVQRFTSANGNVKASTDMFLALNNAILAGGATQEVQASALEQMSQAYAKNKMEMEEWRSIMTAMPAQLKQVALAMGYVSADALGEDLREGEVSMNDFMKTLVQLNKEGANGFQSFEQQARNATGGVGTSIANVKTAITRGLTDIMNAIGQSNIAGFFQGIAKAINNVVPYITAFVKVCASAVNYISKLFGNKTNSDVKSTNKNINKTSTSMGNLGTSASSTSKNLDKTTGSAKKLKKELNGLASFDEMNVLTEKTSNNDDEDTGSVSDLGDWDLSGWDSAMDDTSSKADEIAEKMKNALKGIAGIMSEIWNSAPVQAFSNLVGAQFNFIKGLAVQLGTDLWNNMTMTWNNIQGNVSTIITNISLLFTQMFTDMATTIETWGEPIIEGVSNLFNSIWLTAVDPAIQLITQAWADFSGILVSLWDEHGGTLLNNMGEFVTKTIELFQSIYDNVLEPIITPFLETLSWLWDEHLSKLIEKIGDFIGKLANGALEIYNKFIQPIVTFLLDKLSPAWSFLSSLVIGVLGTILGTISDVVGSIIGVLGGVIDFITGIFTGNWKKAWNGVKDIFKNIVDGLVGIFKAPINLIIDGINAFISGLNKIKIPDWVPAVGGKGINIPKIPKLAQGGIIDKPTVAVVGEAGKEVVMPLENNTGWIDTLANKLRDKIGNNDNPIHLTVKVGEDTLLDKVIQGMKDKSFETNGEVFNV